MVQIHEPRMLIIFTYISFVYLEKPSTTSLMVTDSSRLLIAKFVVFFMWGLKILFFKYKKFSKKSDEVEM